MNASAFPKPSLRPYLAADFPLLSEIRFAAIEELDVKFLHEPPPDAKFIAKISFSSGSRLASMFPCVITTPLGAEVAPEVKIICAMELR